MKDMNDKASMNDMNDKISMKDMKDKVLGSMVGGAVGDALGYPVEFVYSYSELAQRYGEGGIKEYDCLDFDEYTGDPIAIFSDDTQMTLFTAEGLLYAVTHNEPILPMICNAYLYWYRTQTGNKFIGAYPSELVKMDELNRRRAPGNTCIEALTSIHAGKDPANDSKGCGGIMRIAPIALYGATHGWALEQTAKLAGDVAEITHLHQMSTLASACCAAIIQQCVLEDDCITLERFKLIVTSALGCTCDVYSAYSAREEFCKLIDHALQLHDSQLEDWQVIEGTLGGGWVAEETLAIVVFCVARHIDSFEACVVAAVNHGGDSDSTGAVAGNIIGAILGRRAIPEKFTKALQLRELIENMACKLL